MKNPVKNVRHIIDQVEEDMKVMGRDAQTALGVFKKINEDKMSKDQGLEVLESFLVSIERIASKYKL